MTTIKLTGLRGNHPLKALAAFGLLRVLHDRTAITNPRLSWDRTDNLAILHLPDDCDREQLLDTLVESMRGRDQAAYLTESKEIKMPPAEFPDYCERVLEKTPPECRREAAGFLAAYASELVTDRAGNNVKPTPFHMTAGMQRFPYAGAEIAATLNPDRELTKQEAKQKNRQSVLDKIRVEIATAFERALFGPWESRDPLHSLGFDPGMEALYALSDQSPSKAGATSERAAVWLGVEALPLFPCLPKLTNRGQLVLQTRGFERGKSTPDWFRWPLWTPPVTLLTLRSLLGIPPLLSGNPEAGFRKHLPWGVFALYQADCVRDGNGRGTFRHAVPLFLDT